MACCDIIECIVCVLVPIVFTCWCCSHTVTVVFHVFVTYLWQQRKENGGIVPTRQHQLSIDAISRTSRSIQNVKEDTSAEKDKGERRRIPRSCINNSLSRVEQIRRFVETCLFVSMTPSLSMAEVRSRYWHKTSILAENTGLDDAKRIYMYMYMKHDQTWFVTSAAFVPTN